MHVGFAEIVVVVCIASVCLGPEKLPVYARKLGQKFSMLKLQYALLAREFQSEMDEIKEVQDMLEKPSVQKNDKREV